MLTKMQRLLQGEKKEERRKSEGRIEKEEKRYANESEQANLGMKLIKRMMGDKGDKEHRKKQRRSRRKEGAIHQTALNSPECDATESLERNHTRVEESTCISEKKSIQK